MRARRLLYHAAVQGAALAMLAGSAHASAAMPSAAGPSAVAARVDGAPVYVFTVDTLWRQERAATPSLERKSALDSLITSRLLAGRAAGGPSGATMVGFAPEVAVDERLAATLREVYGKEIDAAVKALPGATLESLVIARPAPAKARLEAIFGRPGPLLMEIALSAGQQEQASMVEVLRYQFPGGEPVTVSLLDVYLRQNVQGRLALSQQPAKVAAQQARLILANDFVKQWAVQRFGSDAVADLRQAIADGEAVVRIGQLHGIGMHTDSGSSLLNRMAGEATPAEIEAFYYRHKDQFARIEKVRARHIRVPDEAQAQHVLKSLQTGASFADTASSSSRAPDAGKGGDLGWIHADDAHDWLASLAFSQQPGKPSAPIRAPVGPNEPAYWEIVLVEERIHGAHPLQSETVRYQASRMIALKKAMQLYAETVANARRNANIEILEAQ